MNARRLVLACLLVACDARIEVLERKPVAEPSMQDAGLDAAVPLVLDGGGDAATTYVLPDGAVVVQLERVLATFAQTCAVRDRALYCWGADSSGQVGVAGNASQLLPVRISSDQFVDVCAGEVHSCALREDGVALCWGDNAAGQLGTSDLQPRETPTEVPNLRFANLACGGKNTCGITARGELFCWGENLEGRLGQDDPMRGMPGSLGDSAMPLAVRADLRFTDVSLGQGHVCAITTDHGLYCWGRNSEGQLGVRDTSDQQRAPVRIDANTSYATVAAGQRHTCAVDVTGKLFCWGQNLSGLLGLVSDDPLVRVPTQVGSGSDYARVSVSWFHSCALRKTGTLVCWGRNEEGQLGLGDMTPRMTPARVGYEGVWTQIATGQFHTCAYAKTQLYCWGANDTGQLGLGDTARRYVPIPVPFN